MGKSRRSKSIGKSRISGRRRGISPRRKFAAIGITLGIVVLLVGILVFSNNLKPKNPSVVTVIIPEGASVNLHLGFEPAKITIVIGINNTVIWKNEDSDWHTAHSNIPEFNSGLIQPGDSFTHTFERAGTYPYHCDPHPWMTGVVTVQGSTGELISPWPYYGLVTSTSLFSVAVSRNQV